MSNPKRTVLVVDDDPNILKGLSLRLGSAGYNVLNASNGADALLLAEIKNPDIIVTDIWMPVGVGFSLVYRLKRSRPDMPIIFLTASKRPDLRVKAKELGVVGFLEKPYDPEALLGVIRRALENKRPPEKVCRTDDGSEPHSSEPEAGVKAAVLEGEPL
jgi:DNA-binding NtrC family response regulator